MGDSAAEQLRAFYSGHENQDEGTEAACLADASP